MSMVCTRVVLALMAFLGLVGCSAVGGFNPDPAPGVTLAGSWILDRAASEDPQPVLAKLRPKPRRDLGPDELDSQSNGPPEGQQGGSRGGGRGGRGGPPPNPAYRNNNDAFTHGQVIKALNADLARAESLTISQGPQLFSMDYGAGVRSFTPGLKSVVGADWGVADQSSGWKGKQYIIEIKPQTGVASVEKYSLSSDGKRLLEELRLGGGEFPVAELKRVYDRTDKPIPRSAPSND